MTSIKDDRVDLCIAVADTTAGPDQRIVWELATRLSPARFQTEAWLLAEPSMDPLAEALGFVDVPVQRLAGSGWRGFLELRAQLKRRRPVLLHLHHPLGAGRRWALALIEGLRDARLVITQDTLDTHDLGISRAIDRRIVARADAIVVPSADVADHLVRDLGVERSVVRTLAEGVDLPDPEAETDRAGQDLGTLGGGPFRPIWLCPEPLDAEGGHETLIQALVRLRDQGLPFLAVWTGEGRRRDVLEERARTLGLEDRVRFVPGADRSRAMLAAAELVVFPSAREESTPLVLEAMARGRAVIACAGSVAAEPIENGSTGCLFGADDEIELAAALEGLARRPNAARRMGAAAAQRVHETHTWARVVESFEAVYDEVLGFATFAPESARFSPSKR